MVGYANTKHGLCFCEDCYRKEADQRPPLGMRNWLLMVSGEEVVCDRCRKAFVTEEPGDGLRDSRFEVPPTITGVD